MAKRIGLTVSGSVLIGLFLAWMLVKGTDAVESWIDPNPVLGVAAWGVACLCALGGAALITRALYRQTPDSIAEVD